VLMCEFHSRVIETSLTKQQLQSLVDQWKAYDVSPKSDLEDGREDMILVEEIKDFALEDMGKLFICVDPSIYCWLLL